MEKHRGFKGFTKDLRCVGPGYEKQYEIGQTYEEAEAELCVKGLHHCENPLDCLSYYHPSKGSRYAEILAENSTDEKDNDSKRVAKKITIVRELSLSSLIDAGVKFTFKEAIWKNKDNATGDQGAASATGYQGAASATGDRGAASATGGLGAASATGYQGAASATGDLGAASATGGRGAASATGYRGAASATGDLGAASTTGYQGAASATGDRGAASATGYQGAASATGYQSVAMAVGNNSKSKGALGCWIVLAEWARDDNGDWHRIDVQSKKIDGVEIKPDTWYKLKNGIFVEVQD